MKIMTYLVDDLSLDEVEYLKEKLDQYREEKARQRAIIEQEQQIGEAIAIAISVIGLEETKRIVRQAARDLRNIENSESL